jgi:hypothetical protein
MARLAGWARNDQRLLFLHQGPGVERRRRVRTKRGVDAVVEEVVDLVAPVAGAEVPVILAKIAAHAAIDLIVGLVLAELRREADRIQRVQAPTRERGAGAVRGVGRGVAPVEVGDARAVGIGGETIGLDRVGQRHGGVEAGAPDGAVGLAPALHGVGHLQGRIGGLEGDGVWALARARGGLGVGIVERADQIAAVAQLDAISAADLGLGPVAFIVLTGLGVAVEALAIAENDVDHPGDGVRAILRRGAVAQHLDALHAAGRELGHVDALLAATAQHRRAVAALAVDHHQGLVGRQAAQGGGAHEGLAVGGRQALNIE